MFDHHIRRELATQRADNAFLRESASPLIETKDDLRHGPPGSMPTGAPIPFRGTPPPSFLERTAR